MPDARKKLPPSKRIALYRKRAERSGISRVEVSVPARDVAHIRAFARVLREDGEQAERLRMQGARLEGRGIARTGEELVAQLCGDAQERFVLDLPARHSEDPRKTGF